jgi:hypothetical protein
VRVYDRFDIYFGTERYDKSETTNGMQFVAILFISGLSYTIQKNGLPIYGWTVVLIFLISSQATFIFLSSNFSMIFKYKLPIIVKCGLKPKSEFFKFVF